MLNLGREGLFRPPLALLCSSDPTAGVGVGWGLLSLGPLHGSELESSLKSLCCWALLSPVFEPIPLPSPQEPYQPDARLEVQSLAFRDQSSLRTLLRPPALGSPCLPVSPSAL